MTPESLFEQYAYLAVAHANRLQWVLKKHSYRVEDLIQEGLLVLWKTVQKPQVLNTTRPATLQGYFSVVIYRALNGLKRHAPHVSYHNIGGLA